jgi:hypothetical protein
LTRSPSVLTVNVGSSSANLAKAIPILSTCQP